MTDTYELTEEIEKMYRGVLGDDFEEQLVDLQNNICTKVFNILDEVLDNYKYEHLSHRAYMKDILAHSLSTNLVLNVVGSFRLEKESDYTTQLEITIADLKKACESSLPTLIAMHQKKDD